MKKSICLGVLIATVLTGCSLKDVEVKKLQDVQQYKYAVVTPTQKMTSGMGNGILVSSGYDMGSTGFSGFSTKTINPSDVITGILMKKNYIILDKVDRAGTIVMQYGQGEKRDIAGGLGGYALSVIIQAVDGQTQELVFMCSAEGSGKTEADSIREAIERCLKDF